VFRSFRKRLQTIDGRNRSGKPRGFEYVYAACTITCSRMLTDIQDPTPLNCFFAFLLFFGACGVVAGEGEVMRWRRGQRGAEVRGNEAVNAFKSIGRARPGKAERGGSDRLDTAHVTGQDISS
jgi:hypothetical protein